MIKIILFSWFRDIVYKKNRNTLIQFSVSVLMMWDCRKIETEGPELVCCKYLEQIHESNNSAFNVGMFVLLNIRPI